MEGDEDGNDQDDDEDKFGIPEIQEVDDEHDQSSLLFNDNDNSKIEPNSSIGGNGSRIMNNNLITSSSFHGDNSLLIFANNFIINNNQVIDNNNNNNVNFGGNISNIDNSQGLFF